MAIDVYGITLRSAAGGPVEVGGAGPVGRIIGIACLVNDAAYYILRATNELNLITDDLTDLCGSMDFEFNSLLENQVSMYHDVLSNFHTYRLAPFVTTPTLGLPNHDVAGNF